MLEGDENDAERVREGWTGVCARAAQTVTYADVAWYNFLFCSTFHIPHSFTINITVRKSHARSDWDGRLRPHSRLLPGNAAIL